MKQNRELELINTKFIHGYRCNLCLRWYDSTGHLIDKPPVIGSDYRRIDWR